MDTRITHIESARKVLEEVEDSKPQGKPPMTLFSPEEENGKEFGLDEFFKSPVDDSDDISSSASDRMGSSEPSLIPPELTIPSPPRKRNSEKPSARLGAEPPSPAEQTPGHLIPSDTSSYVLEIEAEEPEEKKEGKPPTKKQRSLKLLLSSLPSSPRSLSPARSVRSLSPSVSIKNLWIQAKTGFFDEAMEEELEERTKKLIKLYQDEESKRTKVEHVFKKKVNKDAVYVAMRSKALKSKRLGERVQGLLVRQLDHEADVVILQMAQRECQTRFEKKALAWYRKAKKEVIEAKEELAIFDDDEEEEEEVKKYTINQVRLRHLIGWAFICTYSAMCAFYVCLFGINYGPAYARAWLRSFFIAFCQDLVLFLTLKLLLLYVFLPWLCFSKINPHRLKNLPSYAASTQVAHQFPDLPASQLIINRADPQEILEQQEAFSKLFLDNRTFKYRMFVVAASLIQVALYSIFLLPEDFQEVALDTMLPISFNYILIGLLKASIAFPSGPNVFWALLSCVLIMAVFFTSIYTFRNKIQHTLQKCLPSLKHG